MIAIVEDRTQQYRVAPGDKVLVAFHDGAEEGATLTFDKVCLVTGDGGEGAKIGTPYVDGVTVTAKVLRPEVKGDKLVVAKYRRRKNSRRRTGFRARYTEVRIEGISA
jgi:large subunit ribosomal protein L21